MGRPDGSPYHGKYNRVVFIETSHEGKHTHTPPLEKVLIPDDNLVAHTVTPDEGDTRIRVRVRPRESVLSKQNYFFFL